MRTQSHRKAPPPEPDHAPVIERPDGFYWLGEGGREYGPFASLLAALQDQEDTGDDEAIDAGGRLDEAEAGMGLADADPEARTLAEEDGAPIEEH